MLNGSLYRFINVIFLIIFYLCVLMLFSILLQITMFTSFRIPTDSMQPTLQPGDNILVNKSIMGARIFNIWDAAEEKEVEIHRLPGLGKVKQNDVLVFHYPYPHKNDSLSMHLLKYYVKRCIALPGDTMGIRKGHYYIKGIGHGSKVLHWWGQNSLESKGPQASSGCTDSSYNLGHITSICVFPISKRASLKTTLSSSHTVGTGAP